MNDRRALLIVAGLVLALALAVGGVFLRWKLEEPHRQYEQIARMRLELCLSHSLSQGDTATCVDQFTSAMRAWDQH